MDDGYRTGRDDGQRRFMEGGREREPYGGDRWSERNGYGTEPRSFEEGGRFGGDGGGEHRPHRRARTFGADVYGRGYGHEDYGGYAYGAQGYAGASSAGTWRGGGYERATGVDYGAAHGEARPASPGTGGRAWAGGFAGELSRGNAYTRRVADGDFEPDWRDRYGDDRDERRLGEHRGRGPRNYQRSDERIREDVSDRLCDDSWLDAGDIDVKVKDGEVTLDGKVRTRTDKRRAEDIAEDVSGVKHVQCNLRVDRPQGQAGSTQGTEGQRRPAGTA